MTAAAWSADGSVLAVAAGDSPTLWEPASSALLAALPPPAAALNAAVQHLCFVAGTPFLVRCNRALLHTLQTVKCTGTRPP